MVSVSYKSTRFRKTCLLTTAKQSLSKMLLLDLFFSSFITVGKLLLKQFSYCRLNFTFTCSFTGQLIADQKGVILNTL